MSLNYIYLIQERKFVEKDEKIYKIGKTKKYNLDWLNRYPLGTILIMQIICSDCDYLEKKLIQIFLMDFNI
jgi:hypothetical protein